MKNKQVLAMRNAAGSKIEHKKSMYSKHTKQYSSLYREKNWKLGRRGTCKEAKKEFESKFFRLFIGVFHLWAFEWSASCLWNWWHVLQLHSSEKNAIKDDVNYLNPQVHFSHFLN